jgi:Ca-activated chloride channel family protein
MLCEDVKPNRFEKARLMMVTFSKKLKGDRVGLVTFAGSSFLSCPLTLDTAAFKIFLDAVQVGFNPDPGSDLASALDTAIKAFPGDNRKHQAIILFSDGDDHALETLEVAKKAQEKGIRIYTVGIGTSKGDVIPLKDDKGRKIGIKKDRQGQIVITPMKEDRLQAISKATDGLYFPASGSEKEMDLIYEDMRKMGQKQFKEQTITQKEDRFEIFLILAFLLFLGEFLLGERKKELI